MSIPWPPPAIPPEIAKAAEAAAEELWAAVENDYRRLDMPDTIDLSTVKPLVIGTLRLAFCRGALLPAQRGMEALEAIQRARAKKGGPPHN